MWGGALAINIRAKQKDRGAPATKERAPKEDGGTPFINEGATMEGGGLLPQIGESERRMEGPCNKQKGPNGG